MCYLSSNPVNKRAMINTDTAAKKYPPYLDSQGSEYGSITGQPHLHSTIQNAVSDIAVKKVNRNHTSCMSGERAKSDTFIN